MQRKFGISGSTLKLVAIITMLIDHTAASFVSALIRQPYIMANVELHNTLVQVYGIMRDIGRLAFPIFCFLLVEGFLHTHDVKKYAARLFLFALISEIPFDFALKANWFFPSKQNVYFTLLIGLLVLWGIQLCRGRIPLQLIIMIAGLWAADFMQTDYSYRGVFLIEVLYIFRFSRLYQCLAGAAAICWEPAAPPAYLLVYFYNGKRGLKLKYFFYWFYPAHLMILGILTKWVLPMFA